MRELLPHTLARILSETPDLKEAFLVGGCVRDWLFGIPNKDYDIEVFGANYEQLAGALSRWGRIDLVGRSFGVIKLTVSPGETYDFSIPRRDSKVAPGHKGFSISIEPNITPKEAAARRDFTINSLLYNPRDNQVLDFFGGAKDIQARVLRHTSAAFVEDPLRVLRGMQFIARFGLKAADETLALCREMKASYGELALERIRDEWFKWAEKSTVPSAGLRFLNATGWIEHFPEVHALKDTQQDPEWHPEGDVFVHTCHCCDALARLPEWQAADPESRIVYMLAVLAHDFGKPASTHQSVKDGKIRIVSPGHETIGSPIAETFLTRIHAPTAIRERVLPLVINHMAHLQRLTDRAVRRLAKRLEPENIHGLCIVITADQMGRPPKPARVPDIVSALRSQAAELQVQSSPPKPILLGRHLLDLGLDPGPQFRPILDRAYDAQLEGRFFNLKEAKQWLVAQKDFPLSNQIRESLQADLD
jgi:tRNA nucleotidyltransferase (CCA-adding enzyme)